VNLINKGSGLNNTRGEITLTLFSGAGCHLCELAGDILDEAVGKGAYEVVIISDNEQLMASYGERIPVVKNNAGKEKGWPFTVGQVRKLASQ